MITILIILLISISQTTSQAVEVVQSFHKFSGNNASGTGGFTAVVNEGDNFGASGAYADINNDGMMDLVIGAQKSQDNYGSIYVLFLRNDMTVLSHQRLLSSDLTAEVNADYFGSSVCSLDDFNENYIEEHVLAVGAYGGNCMYVLFLNQVGHVNSFQKISETHGAFTSVLDYASSFGVGLSSVGDLNNDATGDIAVGSYKLDADEAGVGAVYLLFLSSTGSVISFQKISSDGDSGFTANLAANDNFGRDTGWIGDVNQDNSPGD